MQPASAVRRECAPYGLILVTQQSPRVHHLRMRTCQLLSCLAALHGDLIEAVP
jgi:hypothetical protein